MDNNQIPGHGIHGAAGTLLSIISAILAWISLQQLQVVMATVASGVAALSGCLAGYHWLLSIQEKRRNLKNSNNAKP